MRPLWVIAGLAVGAFAVPGAASAAVDAYLYLPGVTGGATDPAHKGWIEVSSYQLGSTQPVTRPTNTGAGAGRATSDVVIVKQVDSSSPVLFQRVATGINFPSAEVDVVGAGGQIQVIYKLTDVAISSDQQSGASGDNRPSETVTLSFAKVEMDNPPGAPASRGVAPATLAPTTNAAPRRP